MSPRNHPTTKPWRRKALNVFLWLLLAVLLFQSSPQPAHAQMTCATYAEMKEKLAASFSEELLATALSKHGSLFQIYVFKGDKNNGPSWTLVNTTPDGVSCVVSVGSFWEINTKQGAPL